jgi:hypothetical protein
MDGENKDKIEKELTRAMIIKELKPLIDSIRAMNPSSSNFKLFKESYCAFCNRYTAALDCMEYLVDEERKLSNDDVGSVIHSLFTYLGLVESLGNNIVNIIVMLLVANGTDFHIESSHGTPRVKHVTSIKALEDERTPLASKLNFMRENNVPTLVSLFDTKLRNDIAHLNFIVKDNEIYLKGKRGLKLAKDVVFNTRTRLFDGINIALELLDELDKEKGLSAA